MALLLAETSKTGFYIAGGVLALWAVVLSAIGLTRDRFPGRSGGGVMALSFVLMIGAMAAAVATASKPSHGGKAELKPLADTGGASASAPAASSSGGSASGGSSSGGSSSGAAAAPSLTLDVKADPAALAFQEKTLTAKAGTVTVDFTNPSSIPHNVTIEGGGKQYGATKTIGQGKASAKVKLKAGTYTFYCSVPGHRAAGMAGQLTVQ